MNAVDRERLYAQEVGPDALERQKRAKAPRCRSCDRPMRWVDTKRGRKMPVDYDPHEDGNVVVHANGRADVYQSTPTEIPAGATLHFSHFARRRASEIAMTARHSLCAVTRQTAPALACCRAGGGDAA